MTTDRDALASAAYALFALQQPIDLAELAAAAAQHRFPLAATQTPDWFAAAATGDADLLEMAPELQVLPVDLEEAGKVDVTGIDLIHVYAPEMQALEELEEAEEEAPAPPPAPPVEQPRTSTQLGLLKELGDLDS